MLCYVIIHYLALPTVQYLKYGDVPGETLHSFALLASLQSLFLAQPGEIFMEVHTWKTQTTESTSGMLHRSRGVGGSGCGGVNTSSSVYSYKVGYHLKF